MSLVPRQFILHLSYFLERWGDSPMLLTKTVHNHLQVIVIVVCSHIS